MTAGTVLGATASSPTWATALAVALCALGALAAGARWLRVAQREHYLPGACTRFAWRWWRAEPVNVVLAGVGVAGVVVALWWPAAAAVTALVAVAGPRGLTLRGRTAPLAATRRLRTLAAVWLGLWAAVVLAGVGVGVPAAVAAAAALGAPLLVDAAGRVLAPLERRLGQRYVDAARRRLGRVAPVVVGVTGSFGKTSTKRHIADLVEGTRTVVASPASYNNRAGLARAVNEHLVDGTEVFVAEMGTYGPGEIADLCAWCPPELAVLTAVGPVHLERFGSEERIVAAKSEIARDAAVVVLNVDDARLAALADRLAAEPRPGRPARALVRCSAHDTGADVCVRRLPGDSAEVEVTVGGRSLGRGPLAAGLQPTNVACALAVALRLGVPESQVLARLGRLAPVPNRLSAGVASSGVLVIDDTFNSNPAGARAALARLAAAPVGGRRVLVTPGMVELGPRQAAENEALARAAAPVVTDLVVVGLTNRRALTRGAAPLQPRTVRTRDQAVAWVRQALGPGDAVLYENDLPDHYP